ncbi:M56 family metallopeptidase [Mesobacillus maritimus]|uniref:M56 family metallopeptidase n=1 Tax=Mesobacillus maritimus TaxID=1643336 RepID=UPI00203C748F|nr:M56 family metallopeptidase [Mesobacillus maritimus]MCM3669055.1 M56 family metallopeptidase [Mesobacillus maritimus]
MPDNEAIVLVVFTALLIQLFAVWLPKKVSGYVELLLVLTVLALLFIQFPVGDAMLLMSYGATTYTAFVFLIDRGKREKQIELKELLEEVDATEIFIERDHRRILADLLLTVIVCMGALTFFLFAPDTYTLLKMVIVFMFITILAKSIERVGNFYSTRLYWVPEDEHLIVLSKFQSREFPLQDLKGIYIESSPDLLKLHPLFTLISVNQDYTSSFGKVLRLAFPGEYIFVTPKEFSKWEQHFKGFISEKDNQTNEQTEQNILPLWHPIVLKRLFFKGYFAVTVKGISAYTGLLLLLIWLEAPWWLMVTFVLLWWGFNLSISDRVLIAATDATRVPSGDLYDRAQAIFRKAGVPGTKLFVMDSPVYNGLATGMNIGRSAVILTSATLQLPAKAVDAIIAHEAIHVKKRDILTTQIARIFFLGCLAGLVYFFFDEIQALADYFIVLTLILYLLMMIFPIYLSFVAQWLEVRADFLGGALLTDGHQQMAKGLTALVTAQDHDIDKGLDYSMSKQSSARLQTSNKNRDSWFWRFIEFQFQNHPPMYWRIYVLSNCSSWPIARKRWITDRFKESLPDFLRKSKMKEV